ncbi:P2Y purinoceptor 8-like [Leucoraja erinacea]|uniref:P2Y purinoceptor 8-like n=1 Tax=Leucoraja erinaceus TaxID=7782 RepID=UPI002457F413|nr:P2Y purinoceptor 8-like [Leucoraja erinacea]
MHGLPKILLFAIYYPVIAAIGIPANVAVIWILCRRRCGLSGCITLYLLSMAVTDLLVLITAVILNRVVAMNSPANPLTFSPLCNVNFVLVFAVRDCSVWTTVVFTFDRFVAICCHKLKATYCRERIAAAVVATVCALSSFKNAFRYFMFEPLAKGEATPCKIKLSFYTSPAWVAFDWIDSILTPCLPFVLILLLNFLTVRHILRAISTRRKLRGNEDREGQRDPETENRRRSIVLLLSISGLFILLWLLALITFLYIRIASVTYFSGSNFNESNFLLEESGYMLQFLCSCANPFIYAGTQNRFRAELKLGLKYPLSLIGKLRK